MLPDAWIDHEKTKVGYAIPFRQHFHVHQPTRDLAEIDADYQAVDLLQQRRMPLVDAAVTGQFDLRGPDELAVD